MYGENSISVVIPALNEERNLASTVGDVCLAARRQFDRFELIIVNDGSSDETGEIAARLSEQIDEVLVVNLTRTHGLGGAFKEGLSLATMHFVTEVHGKGGTSAEELGKIWSLKGQADIIAPYILNENERPRWRLMISRAFRTVVNVVFGVRVRYHMHHALYKRNQLQGVRIRSNNYTAQAECLIKMLKLGHSFLEVGVHDSFDNRGPTRSYSLANVVGVVTFFPRTLFDLHVGRPRVLAQKSKNTTG